MSQSHFHFKDYLSRFAGAKRTAQTLRRRVQKRMSRLVATQAHPVYRFSAGEHERVGHEEVMLSLVSARYMMI
ncbi:hypothetical protein GE061_011084 [Apolygus lucorum]|uniref:Uncharacterized protein n=1 Tax=Apolygus lucorum TaxID=248454 RepID=A0A6A4JJZ8_APOLU|nr:hypothetical protein GE061_011084 [Apolygus lucorum]